jgi:hypothetical protein
MGETHILIKFLWMYFHGTGNLARLCQNFEISGGFDGFKPPPQTPLPPQYATVFEHPSLSHCQSMWWPYTELSTNRSCSAYWVSVPSCDPQDPFSSSLLNGSCHISFCKKNNTLLMLENQMLYLDEFCAPVVCNSIFWIRFDTILVWISNYLSWCVTIDVWWQR